MQRQFSQWLAERTRLSGLSQRELTDGLGVNRSVVSRWFRGEARPGTENITRLAQVLDAPLQEILDAAGYDLAPNSGPEISAEERQLLTMYRRLSPGHREVLQLIARGLARLDTPDSPR
jgi:transcriptional regulator with XRE-family HTH domain